MFLKVNIINNKEEIQYKDSCYNVVQLSKSRKMPAMIIQIITLIGMSLAVKSNSLISDLITDALENLSEET